MAHSKYGFGEMEVGAVKKFTERQFHRAVNAAIRFGAYHGIKFTSCRASLTIKRIA